MQPDVMIAASSMCVPTQNHITPYFDNALFPVTRPHPFCLAETYYSHADLQCLHMQTYNECTCSLTMSAHAVLLFDKNPPA